MIDNLEGLQRLLPPFKGEHIEVETNRHSIHAGPFKRAGVYIYLSEHIE